MQPLWAATAQNISQNRALKGGLFPAFGQRARPYIEAMKSSEHLCWVRLLTSWAVVAALAVLCASLMTTAALAQASEPGPIDSAIEQQVRELALAAVNSAAAVANPGSASGVTRVDISVGSLDKRLRLAPCQRVEPYLPPNTKLWGQTRIGLRCAQGATAWNVYLPITVKVYGQALVGLQPLAAGSVIGAADLVKGEVDLAEDNSDAVRHSTQAVGRTLAKAIAPGQSLRLSHLKVRQWFAAGETVQVSAQGSGFSIVSEAQALTAGIEGQPARARTEAGRVLTGVAVGERKMEVAL